MKDNFVLCILLSLFLETYCSGAAGGVGSSKDQGESMNSNTTKFLKKDQSLVLECKIETKDALVQWHWTNRTENKTILNEDDGRYKIENHTLTIVSAVNEDYGYYHCESIGISPQEHYNISVLALSYKRMPKSITVLESEKLKLECDATGTPTPSILWFKDKKIIDEAFNNSHYDLKQSNENVPNGTLEIPDVVMSDRGEYMCLITSQGAKYNTTTYVRVKHMYAALWPFLGICAEVIILCLIIFIYEKRRIKNDFEESDTDQPADHKNTSHNKDIRQRK